MSRPSRARITFRYCRASKAAQDRALQLLQWGCAARLLRFDAEYRKLTGQAERLRRNLPAVARDAIQGE